MGIISGNSSRLQLGIGDTWGQGDSATIELPFTSESLKYNAMYADDDTLVGGKTKGTREIIGHYVSGDISINAKPDRIGALLALTLGGDTSTVTPGGDTSSGDTAFTHTLTPIAAGAATSLKPCTLIVDRIVNVFGYNSCKITKMSMKAAVKDFVRMTFSVIGYDEDSSASLNTGLTRSSIKTLKFSDGAITMDTSDYADVTAFNLDYDNKLETELFTLSSGDYMAEIEPQERMISGSIDVLYSSATDDTRENKFKAGASGALVLTFTGDDLIDAALYYKMTITIPIAYITEDPSFNVAGKDRLKGSIKFEASEDATHEAITIEVINADSAAYV